MAVTKTNRCRHCKFFTPYKAPNIGGKDWKRRYAATWGKCRSTTAAAKAVLGYPKRHKMDYCNSFSQVEGPQPETEAPRGFWQEVADKTQHISGAPRIKREFKPEEKKKLGLDQTTEQQEEVHQIMNEGVHGMKNAATRGRAKPHAKGRGRAGPGQKKRGRPPAQVDLEEALARLDDDVQSVTGIPPEGMKDASAEYGGDIPGAPPVLKIEE